MTGRLV